MELVEKRIYYVDLLHIYGELLSPTQKEILIDYLECDLSLSEIAENKDISRSAVEDAIKKGMKKLDAFEEAVKYHSAKQEINKNTQLLKEKFGNCAEIEDIEGALK